jgi:hypothetical protein
VELKNRKNMRYLAITILFVMSCGGPQIDMFRQITPRIEIKEAVAIASAYLDSTCCKDQYIKDSVHVWEWAANINSWNVQFKRNQSIKPPTIIVMVNKENGSAALLMQK